MGANRFTAAAKKAANLTNTQLADEITKRTKLSGDQVKELLPNPTDRKAFLNLMKKVDDETAMDKKLAFLRDNLETAGKVVFKVLKTLA